MLRILIIDMLFVRKEPSRRFNGFTLVEAVLYAAVLAVVITILAGLTVNNFTSYRAAKVKGELVDSADRVAGAFLQETKNARRVYLPTTVLDGDFGELSLETSFRPADETEPVTFTDIYWASGRVWIKRENKPAQPLSGEDVEATRFKLVRSNNVGGEGARLYLTLKSKSRPDQSIALTAFAFVRGSYTQ